MVTGAGDEGGVFAVIVRSVGVLTALDITPFTESVVVKGWDFVRKASVPPALDAWKAFRVGRLAELVDPIV